MLKTDDKSALILEGGGLRGVFTCGVLDCFMDYGIRFPFVTKITYVDGIYRKKEGRMRIAKTFYRKYPNLVKALSERNTIYNQTMDLIEKLEAEGKITVIRPLRPIEVGRMEKDTSKLAALYQEGYDIAMQFITLRS